MGCLLWWRLCNSQESYWGWQGALWWLTSRVTDSTIFSLYLHINSLPSFFTAFPTYLLLHLKYIPYSFLSPYFPHSLLSFFNLPRFSQTWNGFLIGLSGYLKRFPLYFFSMPPWQHSVSPPHNVCKFESLAPNHNLSKTSHESNILSALLHQPHTDFGLL